MTLSFPDAMTLPPIPDTFRWTVEPWGPALRCEALTACAPHLFTTRHTPLSVGSDWWPVADSLGVRRVVTLTQIHGKHVIVVRKGVSTPRGKPEADVLVSNDPEVAIAVRSADCAALLMCDPNTRSVAAVHAGWRGTAVSVAVAGVEALGREFGAKPEDIVVAVGPAIGACCYEVGTDVVDAYAAAGHPRHLIDRWFTSAPPERGSQQRSPLRLDVAGANHDQLVLAGVQEQNIHMSGLCTAMNTDVLTSFRKERQHAGRMNGVIRAR